MYLESPDRQQSLREFRPAALLALFPGIVRRQRDTRSPRLPSQSASPDAHEFAYATAYPRRCRSAPQRHTAKLLGRYEVHHPAAGQRVRSRLRRPGSADPFDPSANRLADHPHIGYRSGEPACDGSFWCAESLPRRLSARFPRQSGVRAPAEQNHRTWPKRCGPLPLIDVGAGLARWSPRMTTSGQEPLCGGLAVGYGNRYGVEEDHNHLG